MLKKVLSIILGVTFILSAGLKGVEFSVTANKVFEYINVLLGVRDIPVQIDTILAVSLIGVEFFIGFSLLSQAYNKIVLVVAFLMSLAFVLLNTIVYFVGGIEDCGCFGSGYSLAPLQSLIKSVSILIATMVLAIAAMRGSRMRIMHDSQPKLNYIWAIISFGFCSIIMSIPDLVDNHHYSSGVNVTRVDNTDNPYFYIDMKIVDSESNVATYDSREEFPGNNLFLFVGEKARDNDIAKVLSFISNEYDGNKSKISVVSSDRRIHVTDKELNLGIVDKTLFKEIFHSDLGLVIIKDNVIVKKENFSPVMVSLFSSTSYIRGIDRYRILICSVTTVLVMLIVCGIKSLYDLRINKV